MTLIDVKEIPLTRGKVALVDAADFEFLNQWKWLVHSGRCWYAKRSEYSRKKQFMMHREIMRPPAGMVVDHINHDGLDNRRCNLRVCTHRQNAANNRHSTGQSGYRGVQHRYGGWHARVTLNGKQKFLGSFPTAFEAAIAHDIAAIEIFGEFATLNLPNAIPLCGEIDRDEVRE